MIQNEPTGRMVKVTRATGRSSDQGEIANIF